MGDFEIHMWTPPPRKKRDRDTLKADPTRKVKRFQRPVDSDERAMKEWRAREIPGVTKTWEIGLPRTGTARDYQRVTPAFGSSAFEAPCLAPGRTKACAEPLHSH